MVLVWRRYLLHSHNDQSRWHQLQLLQSESQGQRWAPCEGTHTSVWCYQCVHSAPMVELTRPHLLPIPLGSWNMDYTLFMFSWPSITVMRQLRTNQSTPWEKKIIRITEIMRWLDWCKFYYNSTYHSWIIRLIISSSLVASSTWTYYSISINNIITNKY